MTTTNRKEKIRAWLMDKEEALLNFENTFVTVLRNKGIQVNIVKDLQGGGELRYSINKDNGQVYNPRIYLPDKLLEKVNGIDTVILRIITIAHEAGHWGDIIEYYDGNGFKYEAMDQMTHEQDAWQMAYELLDASGFDRFGYLGWRTFRNTIVTYLGTYYYEENSNEELEALDKEKYQAAKKEAKGFANLLLQTKAEKFTKEKEEFNMA